MFEHTILIAPPARQKTGALFASFMAQIGAVGVFIVVPLIFHDSLPALRLAMPDPFFLARLPPPAEPQAAKTVPPRERPSSTIPRIFRLDTVPSPVRPAPEVALLAGDGVPSLTPAFTPPGEMYSAAALSALPPLIEKPQPPTHSTGPAPEPTAPIPIGGDVQAAKLVKKVVPSYPRIARLTRTSGSVHLIGIIGKDGAIQNLQVVSGNPLLVEAAMEAMRQWLYRPTILDGKPVEVIAPIEVIFKLSQ